MIAAVMCPLFAAAQASQPAAVDDETPPDGIIDPVVVSVVDETLTPLPEQKILALVNINTRLNSESIRVLEHYILHSRPESISLEKWYWITNDVMQALCRQETLAPDFVDTLFRIFEDKGRAATLRDYAMQHMALLHTPLPGGLSTLDQAGSRRISRTLLATARDPLSPFCGTALNGLANIVMSQNYLRSQSGGATILDEIPLAQICEVAVALAENDNALPENRTTAFAVCAQYDWATSLVAARKISQDTSALYALRLVAIHHIGRFGASDDTAWLARLASGKEFPIGNAATAALEALKSKNIQ